MGSLCSKASNYQDGHTVLDSSNSASGAAPASAPDPRTAAAEAAERRIQAVSPLSAQSSCFFVLEHFTRPSKGELTPPIPRQVNLLPRPHNKMSKVILSLSNLNAWWYVARSQCALFLQLTSD